MTDKCPFQADLMNPMTHNRGLPFDAFAPASYIIDHHTEVDLGLARHYMRHSVSICTGRDCSVAWSMAWSWFSEFVASGGAVPSTSTSPSLPP